MSEFTKGPWVQTKYREVVGQNGKLIKTRLLNVEMISWDEKEAMANTSLMIAAPDLYDALKICMKAEKERSKKLLKGAPADTYNATRIAMIKSALAKARGET